MFQIVLLGNFVFVDKVGPSLLLVPDSGGLFEGQHTLIGELKAEEEEVSGAECQKAHRHVDRNGFRHCWEARGSHHLGFLPGTASRGLHAS